MAEALITESGAIGIQQANETFFDNAIYDKRYASNEYASFSPLQSLTDQSAPIEFRIDASRAAVCYRINEAVLMVKVKLRKPDDTVPDSSAKVAIANNGLNTLFAKSLLTLSGVPVNPSTDLHYLKVCDCSICVPFNSFFFLILGHANLFITNKSRSSNWPKGI